MLRQILSGKISRAELVRALVDIYQTVDQVTLHPIKDKIGRDERFAIEKQSNCGIAKNFLEKLSFANKTSPQRAASSAAALSVFVTQLSLSPAGGDVGPNPSLDNGSNLRKKIQAVRIALKVKEPAAAAALSDQITPALLDAVSQLQPTQR